MIEIKNYKKENGVFFVDFSTGTEIIDSFPISEIRLIQHISANSLNAYSGLYGEEPVPIALIPKTYLKINEFYVIKHFLNSMPNVQ